MEEMLILAFEHFTLDLQVEDNTHLTICTNVCKWLIDNYFPEGEIWGYHHEDNQTAIIGEAEGGHDFLIVDGCIIDFWQKGMCDTFFPLSLPVSGAATYYGNKNNWEPVMLQAA